MYEASAASADGQLTTAECVAGMTNSIGGRVEGRKDRTAWLLLAGMIFVAAAIVWHSIATHVLDNQGVATPERPVGRYQIMAGTAIQESGIYILDTKSGQAWFRTPELLVTLGGLNKPDKYSLVPEENAQFSLTPIPAKK